MSCVKVTGASPAALRCAFIPPVDGLPAGGRRATSPSSWFWIRAAPDGKVSSSRRLTTAPGGRIFDTSNFHNQLAVIIRSAVATYGSAFDVGSQEGVMRRMVYRVGTGLVVCGRCARGGVRAGDGHCRRREGHDRRRDAGRDGRSEQPGAHRTRAHGHDRRAGPVQDPRPPARHLHGHLHAARVRHRQARGHRAARRPSPRRSTPTCKVGALEETVTVSGASPVVDMQNVIKRQVVAKDTIDAMPTSKNWSTIGIMTDRRQQQPERRRRLGGRASEPAEGARRVVQRSPGAARRADEREHGVQLLVHRHLDQRRVDAGAELRVRRYLRRGRRRRRPGQHHPEGRRQPLQRLGLLQLRQRLAAGQQHRRRAASAGRDHRRQHPADLTMSAAPSAGR